MYSSPLASLFDGIGSSGLIAMTGAFGVFLLVCGFVAAIVLTVLAYRKYVSADAHPSFKISDPKTWGPFVRFERLVVEKVLIALYLFLAIGLALLCAIIVVLGLIGAFMMTGQGYGAAGWGLFFLTLIVQAVIFLLGELLLRLGFELQMLLVIIARNTIYLKNRATGAAVPPADCPTPAPQSATAPGAVSKMQTSASASESHVEAQSASPASPVCPSCGAPYAPGSRFCGICGHPLS